MSAVGSLASGLEVLVTVICFTSFRRKPHSEHHIGYLSFIFSCYLEFFLIIVVSGVKDLLVEAEEPHVFLNKVGNCKPK